MIQFMQWHKGDILVSTDPGMLDLAYIHHFLSRHSYWAEGISLETVKKSVDGSMCFGMYDKGRQIGFARVISDLATFGYLADVFIDQAYRGQGLGVWLMETIMAHPGLQGFRNWQLATRDAHGLYEKFGFKKLDDPGRIMRKNDSDIYKKKAAGG